MPNKDRKVYHAEWYKNNRDRVLDTVRKYKERTGYPKHYYELNKEKQNLASREWNKNNPERRKETRRNASEESKSKERATRRKWAMRNKDKWKKYVRAFRDRCPEKVILYRTRARAKKLGLEFNISEEDIKIPEVCPILNIPIYYEENKKVHSPSIDRVDNTKGYVKGNVRIISNRANAFKSNMSKKDIERLWKYVSEDQA